jgi:hypothetical protein
LPRTKGRLGKLEAELLALDWQQAREGVEVKLLPRVGELYVLARSKDRVAKERAMRRRQLKKLWGRLGELTRMAPPRDALLLKLGAAKAQAPLAWRLVEIHVAADGTLSYSLRKDKLRAATRREGRYLLRSNLCAEDPAQIWRLYMLLVQVEEAFKNLKGDLAVRPIHHQLEYRIEAHILVAFLAFCLHATLRHKLRLKAPGLPPPDPPPDPIPHIIYSPGRLFFGIRKKDTTACGSGRDVLAIIQVSEAAGSPHELEAVFVCWHRCRLWPSEDGLPAGPRGALSGGGARPLPANGFLSGSCNLPPG